ncbi:MAG: TetR/AcrR family transcriptional regulator [Chitinophagaceae bacterium]|nr:TetR/AcrR family transcriptional regulator [Chitinophagaceae bacterium]MBP9102298.1 TetR/AcrR family transcriptional regulator [Chitinophagaceae bacterium]
MSVEIKTRQLEIITAAGEILSESGISGLTTKKLAAKMGFAESALYRHFKSKENIIITMLNYLAADMDKRFAACLVNVDGTELQLKELFNNQFEFFKKNPHFLVTIFSDGLLEESKNINTAIREIMAVKKKYLLPIIKQGQKERTFTTDLSAEELAHIIMGSLRLQMLQWRMSDYAFDVKLKGNKLMTGIITLIKS